MLKLITVFQIVLMVCLFSCSEKPAGNTDNFKHKNPSVYTLGLFNSDSIVNHDQLNALINDTSFTMSVHDITFDMHNSMKFDTLLYQFKNIQWLKIINANLSKLSIDYNRFPYLQVVFFDSCSIHNLFTDTRRFPQLRSISISNCKIDTICSGIESVINLSELSIVNTKNVFLDFDISHFPELYSLFLRKNNMKTAPRGLCNLSFIWFLEIYFADGVKIPDCVYEIKSESVDIGYDSDTLFYEHD